MVKKISILGCGWLGKELAIDFIKKGYDVKGSKTSKRNIEQLKSHGIQPFIIDISHNNLDLSKFLISDVLIIAITSKEVDHFKKLILEIEKSQLRKIIFISSTSVYPYTNGIVTEKTPRKPSILTEIEDSFINNEGLNTTILRFGGLYGYDRKPGNFVKNKNMIDNPEGYINFIHRDDCIKIINEIISKDISNNIFNACTDEHPKRRIFYKEELKKIGILNPVFNDQSVSNFKIVSNNKLKAALNYKFIYGDPLKN